MSKRDYYEILGVGKTASDADLKSAYRKLAIKHHPDKNPGDHTAEDKFKEAAEAYAILADAEKRALYDRYGHAGVSSAAGAGFDPSVFTGFEDILGNLGDIFGFGDLFGGFVARIPVRVILHGELPIRALDVAVARRSSDAQDFVVVALAHAFATFTIAGRSRRSLIM